MNPLTNVKGISEFGLHVISEFKKDNLKVEAMIVSEDLYDDFLKVLHLNCMKLLPNKKNPDKKEFYVHGIKVILTGRLPLTRNLYLVSNAVETKHAEGLGRKT